MSAAGRRLSRRRVPLHACIAAKKCPDFSASSHRSLQACYADVLASWRYFSKAPPSMLPRRYERRSYRHALTPRRGRRHTLARRRREVPTMRLMSTRQADFWQWLHCLGFQIFRTKRFSRLFLLTSYMLTPTPSLCSLAPSRRRRLHAVLQLYIGRRPRRGGRHQAATPQDGMEALRGRYF